ncbi:hypothetical protein SAMN02745181_3004 [Rubritalea squalenifaciens DSM 18772]|uniref:SLA1 homology domain-containing protein n=1 Tax=Rubritalea squalenifaciens DSM 18772 TaxID=1123071 RepID=A0A1M6NXK8_9BACT|nr:hypothetical protein [Rubritalea squalenifaciens]SHK00364.1 hypothetical protein SAMN02745181_3004 [Rubritalea squalenifaciens DSM 18772]
MKKNILTLSLSLLGLVTAQAAEFRIWTSLKGTNVEAQFVKMTDKEVVLTTKAPKEIRLKPTDLSLADRQYLVEYADADKDIVLQGKLNVPEKEIKLPNDFLRELEQTMTFGTDSEAIYNLWETEHFIFAAQGRIRVKGIAETAEACWHGMAFQHYEFRENWGKQKYLVVIPESSESYTALKPYQVKRLKDMGEEKYAVHVENTWDQVGSTRILVPKDQVKPLNLMEMGLVFHTRDDKDFRDDFVPFQTHCLASAMYNFQIGGISQVSGKGYFALSTGHAYYKEILLTGKTETNMLSAETDGEISSKSGFKDGRSWARTLSSLVRKNKVTPKLDDMLQLDVTQLDPEKLVLMYSFSAYMQSTPKRIAAYSKLTRRIHTSNQIPDPSEMARIFGFETVEAFQKDWAEFIMSKDFR